MNEISNEGVIVKQKNRIEELKQERLELKNLIKEQKAYNRLALDDKMKFNNKIINIENEIRGIKRKLETPKEEKQNLVEKIIELIKL